MTQLIDRSNIDEDIIKFVNFMKGHFKKSDEKDKPITHTLLGPLHEIYANYRGSFCIEGMSYQTYIELYKKAVLKMPMYIVERQCEVGPMLIDIDFKLDKTNKDRKYLDDDIEIIIKMYSDLFTRYLNVCKEDVKAFVFEKPEPSYIVKDKVYKDGFHIIYPYISLSVAMRYYIYDKVKTQIIDEDSFGNIPFINEYDDILDSSVTGLSNGFLMYGSKKEGRDPYTLTKIYNHDMTIESTSNYDDNELISILSLRNCDIDDAIPLKKKFKLLESKIEEVYLKYTGDKTKKTQKKKDKIKEVEDDEDEDIKNEIDYEEKKEDTKEEENLKSDISMAKSLIKCMSRKRATVYEDWRNVGWALYNVSNTLLPTFLEFSKKAATYDKDGCTTFWNKSTFTKDGYKISSLHYWARTDNPKKYVEVMRERVKELYNKAQSGTHDDIANVVYEMYKHTYKCVSIAKNKWYEFQECRWILLDSAYSLREKIQNELSREFFLLHSYYLNKASVDEGIEQDDDLKKSKSVMQTSTKLKTVGFVKSVVEACACKFYDRKFEEKLDSNPYLIGFENGVFDLREGRFRIGLPDDLITMSTGYHYEEFHEDDTQINEIKEYFSQVQPDKDLREYLLRFIASCMDGRTLDQKFPIWTGSGCHAKNEKIMMANGTLKNVQDIKIGEYLLGTDGRHRKVIIEFKGIGKMNTIKTDDVSFTVNNNHRLAIRCHYNPILTRTYDEDFNKDIFWVYHHELSEDGPIEIETKFYTETDANCFILELENNPKAIQYGEIVPISVNRLTLPNEDTHEMIQKVMKYYKLFKHNDKMENDKYFEIIDAGEDNYYGYELDGDKKYIMGNGYVTYNSNGKSLTVELIHTTMGDYAAKLLNTVLTRKAGGSGNAVPELADKRGKRFLNMDEPEESDTVYVSKMKELTAGNDKIYARALYGDPFTYKPQFKLILTCNELPHIPSDDGGTWRRIRVLPWKQKYFEKSDKEYNKNDPTHHFKDNTLGERMIKWGPGFAWLILNKWYPRYIKEGLKEPAEVTKFTEAYKKESDVYMEFLIEYLEILEDHTESIDYIFSLFKSWYKEAYDSHPKPKKDLIKYMTKNKYKIDKGLVKGYKVVIPEDRNRE